MALKHFAIYNLTTHEVEDPGNVGPIDDAATEEVYVIVNGKQKKDGTSNLSELRKRALESECVGRGLLNGAWMVYTGSNPFTWEAVTLKPQEVPDA